MSDPLERAMDRAQHRKLISEIERLRADCAWLEKCLRDAVNTCYGGVTHDQIDARSFKVQKEKE